MLDFAASLTFTTIFDQVALRHLIFPLNMRLDGFEALVLAIPVFPGMWAMACARPRRNVLTL